MQTDPRDGRASLLNSAELEAFFSTPEGADSNEGAGAFEAAKHQANKGYLTAEVRARIDALRTRATGGGAAAHCEQRGHHPGGPGPPISRGSRRLREHRTLTVVVDPSLVLKWVLLEDHTEDALELWDRWQSASEHLIFPPVFRSEITKALHQRVHRQEISPIAAADMLDTLLNLVDTDEPSVLYDRALALASSLGQDTVHTSLYLALAELWDCELWTADRPFTKTSRQRSTSVRWVRDDA